MAKPVVSLLSNVTTTGSGFEWQAPSSVSQGQTTKATFQLIGATTASTGTATVTVQVSNDKTNWLTLGTISLSLTTSTTSDGFASDAAWAFFRGNVTSISGTGAAVSLYMVV